MSGLMALNDQTDENINLRYAGFCPRTVTVVTVTVIVTVTVKVSMFPRISTSDSDF